MYFKFYYHTRNEDHVSNVVSVIPISSCRVYKAKDWKIRMTMMKRVSVAFFFQGNWSLNVCDSVVREGTRTDGQPHSSSLITEI
jgi:hypothetical protein